MKRFITKIKRWIILSWYSLFNGMAGGEEAISKSQGGEIDSIGIVQQLRKGGVINDLLEKKVTQEVEELRDKNYRVYEESRHYDTSSIKLLEEIGEDGETLVKFVGTDKPLRKKTLRDFVKKVNLYGEEIMPIYTIQDNYFFEKQNEIPNGLYDYDTTLEIVRHGFIPRFELEKFVTKIVVRQLEGAKRAKVDLYLPISASQFGKIDAILISKLHTIFTTKNFRVDFLDFESMGWVSYKAWNAKDMCLFSYNDIKPEDINKFDGSFVITFDCNIINNGVYLPEKYKRRELDEKYEKHAPKGKAVDLSTAISVLKKKS